ncbi:MAG: hypothetical protein AABX88_02130 [Nanoarchaeota archaeon]
MGNFKLANNRGQLTIFIIVAVVLIAAVVLFFVFWGGLRTSVVPKSIEPMYNSFLSCLESDALVGIDVLESQGGYIELPDFESGSEYMPFSNQLNFLGNPIPYWYYVSGNNIQKEQVPSKSFMESQLEKFIEQEVRDCIFEDYYEQGFEIVLGEPKAKVTINDDSVEVNLNMEMAVDTGIDTALVQDHKVQVNSKLGKLYKNAKNIYGEEQSTLFLENYAVDNLRLYAPVDGVELSCSPLTWSASKVFSDLEEAIELNTQSLKVKGGSFSLNEKENEYFVVDANVDSDVEVRFVNSKEWANMFEVDPVEGSVLISKPVGNQPGMGVLGFCYVPYHYVYNMRYPVLVQVFSELSGEFFQFPVAVVIQGNKPREALDTSAFAVESPELCQYMNTPVQVNTYDTSSKPLDADISYKCFSDICNIGKTQSGTLTKDFPQCVNGFIVVKADGFKESRNLYSTIAGGSVDVILDRTYEKEIELKLEGDKYLGDRGEAVISFISETDSKTIVYPSQTKVELSEGQYEIQVYVYKNSSLKLEGTTTKECMEVPKSGIGGIFGFTDEQCFDINIPEQIISNALAGGGTENYYILESELAKSKVIGINARTLPTPATMEQLQTNYILFEEKDLDVVFK